MLSLPNGHEDFVLYSDAFVIGLGYIMMLRGRMIAYASRQLKVHEKNYLIHDFELATVMIALRIWRHYLYGASFEYFIIVDHARQAQADDQLFKPCFV